MIKDIIMLIMEAVPEGTYAKKDNRFSFESEDSNYVITATENSVEFNIKTIKWIPGSYEPIEGSEPYRTIPYEELRRLADSDKLSLVTGIINELQKK